MREKKRDEKHTENTNVAWANRQATCQWKQERGDGFPLRRRGAARKQKNETTARAGATAATVDDCLACAVQCLLSFYVPRTAAAESRSVWKKAVRFAAILAKPKHL